MRLSIVIPVYKVEQYIEKCIDSLLNQNIAKNEYEIIIINDGSPDSSEFIIESYLSSFNNIVYIKQENAGVSVARNRGMKVAKGKYILFVDPDDSIHENSLEAIIRQAEILGVDVMYLQMEGYNKDGEIVHSYMACGEDYVVAEGFDHPRRTFPATLYTRDVIGDILFIPNVKRGQDTVFNIMVHSLAKKVSYCSVPYYKYLHRPDSSKQYIATEGVFQGCILAINAIVTFQKTYYPQQNNKQKKYFDKAIRIFIERIFQWNIIPSLNYQRFIQIRRLISYLKGEHILDDLAKDYKFVNRHYILFYGFHKLYRIKFFIFNKW